jgi:hypothetical protein
MAYGANPLERPLLIMLEAEWYCVTSSKIRLQVDLDEAVLTVDGHASVAGNYDHVEAESLWAKCYKHADNPSLLAGLEKNSGKYWFFDVSQAQHVPVVVFDKDAYWHLQLVKPQVQPPVHLPHDLAADSELRDYDATRDETVPVVDVIPWTSSSHDFFVFGQQTDELKAMLLSLRPMTLRSKLSRATVAALESSHVLVLENMADFNTRLYDVLGRITGVCYEPEEAQLIGDGGYVLTPDNVMKIVSIWVRLQSNVPVMLQGECGAGKTALLRYMCQWLKAELIVLDVHGGTSAAEITDTVNQGVAKAIADRKQPVFVFLDEFNACDHVGLIRNIIVDRVVSGEALPSNLKVLGALNPYRKRPEVEGKIMPGLVFTMHQDDTDVMSQLVYRVNPVPDTLFEHVFDFGQLESHTEGDYIVSMVKMSPFAGASKSQDQLVADLIRASQSYIRKVEGDSSAASLRDVRRCLRLTEWFLDHVVGGSTKGKKISPMGIALTLGLAFTYWYRLSSSQARTEYWKCLRSSGEFRSFELMELKLDVLRTKGMFQRIILQLQTKFCSNVEVRFACVGVLTRPL